MTRAGAALATLLALGALTACTSSATRDASPADIASGSASPSIPAPAPATPSPSIATSARATAHALGIASSSRRTSARPTSHPPVPTRAASSPAPSRTPSPVTRSPTTAATTETAQPTTTATLSPPPPGGGTCTAARLRLTTAMGGAAQERQYAGIVFTNVSATPCTLRGYPAAQLLRRGAYLGNPAAHDGSVPMRTITLAPHGTAQVVLSAVTSCPSPLSDHVRVIAPGQTGPIDVPLALRACALTIQAVDRS